MKGIVYNLLEDCVSDTYGADTWDDLLSAAAVDGAYTSLGSYPDEELFGLATAASEALAEPSDAIVRWFGRSAMPRLAERYPDLFTPHTTTRAFLLTLNDIIHPEVRKLYPGADVPTFTFAGDAGEPLQMGYRSARRLCTFAEGLVQGAADHYGEQVSISQPRCMLRGDEDCLLQVTLS